MNWDAVVPEAIPMKRAPAPRMDKVYTTNLQQEAGKTSKLFRQKVEEDLRRMYEHMERSK